MRPLLPVVISLVSFNFAEAVQGAGKSKVPGEPAHVNHREFQDESGSKKTSLVAIKAIQTPGFTATAGVDTNIGFLASRFNVDPRLVTSIFVLVPALLGLIWSAIEWHSLKSIHLPVEENAVRKISDIAGFIDQGATSFLMAEYKYMSIYVLFVMVVLAPLISIASSVAFLVGAITSCLCGYIGMKTAVLCNVRTTYMAYSSGLSAAFDVAVRGGSVMGFALVSFGVAIMYILMLVFSALPVFTTPDGMWDALAGYGLGGSSIALFARVGGGIYTKAADVGADLSGKNDYGLEEDDPRNPACIADNVGDNVGDIAGMGADLFGSFAEATCAAMVIAGSSVRGKPGATKLSGSWPAMSFPLMISSSGILVGMVTLWVVRRCCTVTENSHIERALKSILLVSTVLQTPMVILMAFLALPANFSDEAAGMGAPAAVFRWAAIIPVVTGLWTGLIIGYITEFFTSHEYHPVREIANSQKTSAATGVIYGLALGYMSCVVPTLALGFTIVVSFWLSGMYGVALAALGMLSTLTMGLTIDGFGPIADNAGGLAEMANLPAEVREKTDALDAAGNTTAAVGKGFAIGSAALVSLALFGAFCEQAHVGTVNLLDSFTFLGLLLGAMLPFAFSALTMRSVAQAANSMVQECLEQFPKIINEGVAPDYDKCIRIATVSALREMVAPGLLVVVSPLAVGSFFGANCTAGLLAGALVAGVMMAISMSNSGGAWDNSKKFIKAGGLGEEHLKNDTHKNAVTGDTVGDPMKDTSGPSLNILIKLSAITSLVFAPELLRASNSAGGPYWVTPIK
jgi:inorganic pyrophosphatase